MQFDLGLARPKEDVRELHIRCMGGTTDAPPSAPINAPIDDLLRPAGERQGMGADEREVLGESEQSNPLGGGAVGQEGYFEYTDRGGLGEREREGAGAKRGRRASTAPVVVGGLSFCADDDEAGVGERERADFWISDPPRRPRKRRGGLHKAGGGGGDEEEEAGAAEGGGGGRDEEERGQRVGGGAGLSARGGGVEGWAARSNEAKKRGRGRPKKGGMTVKKVATGEEESLKRWREGRNGGIGGIDMDEDAYGERGAGEDKVLWSGETQGEGA